VVGGLTLLGHFNPSFLGTAMGLIALGYAICGNMITYNGIKYSLLNLTHILKYYNRSNTVTTPLYRKPGWDGINKAIKGRLALTGSAIYLIIVLFGLLIYVVTESGIRDTNLYSLVLIGVSLATIFGIVPLVNHAERLSRKANNN
jgi:hypothetical protein